MATIPPIEMKTAEPLPPTPDEDKPFWDDPPKWSTWLSVLWLWTVAMSVLQHHSFWHAVTTMYGLMVPVALVKVITTPHFIWKGWHAPGSETVVRFLIATALLVCAWVLLVGSHGWWWDILAAYVGVVLVLGPFVSRFDDLQDANALKDGRDFWLARSVLLPLLLAATGAAWFSLSLMDRWFHATPVSYDEKRFESLGSPARPVAVALSGGGYRAVLFHSGVLHALEQLHLRPTHVSSVSGGSIVGAFYVRGGSPRALMDAVKEQRFNLRRELADLRNLPRLAFPITLPLFDTQLFPWWSFSRLDVQANLLQDLLLGRATWQSLYGNAASATSVSGRPRLILNTTDVNYGVGIGVAADGVLVTSPLRAVWLGVASSSSFQGGRLARLAAISGAFPGAFPATDVKFEDERHPLKGLHFSVADGGILDNSGVRPLLVVNRLAHGQQTFCGEEDSPRFQRIREAAAYQVVVQAARTPSPVPQGWSFEAIIASDAGKPFRPPEKPMGVFEAEGDVVDRAVSLGGLHASLPLDASCPGDPVPISLYPTGLVDADGQRNRPPSKTTIAHMAASIPSSHFATRGRASGWTPRAWLHRLSPPAPDTLLAGLCACEKVQSPVEPEHLDHKDSEYLGDLIRADIARGVKLFLNTDTLKDTFPTDEAFALFRLGMYAVFEQSDFIQAAAGQVPPHSR